MQLFPTLVPPTYTASGTSTVPNGCLMLTSNCSGSTSQMYSDVKPWLEIGQVSLAAPANTLSGTTPTTQGVSYQWSFTRNPQL
jgi:hypothetical protein